MLSQTDVIFLFQQQKQTYEKDVEAASLIQQWGSKPTAFFQLTMAREQHMQFSFQSHRIPDW